MPGFLRHHRIDLTQTYRFAEGVDIAVFDLLEQCQYWLDSQNSLPRQWLLQSTTLFPWLPQLMNSDF